MYPFSSSKSYTIETNRTRHNCISVFISTTLFHVIKAFNSKVIAVTMSDFWGNAVNKLQTFVNRCLKNILCIRWSKQIFNVRLWERKNKADPTLTKKSRKGN